MPNNIAKETPVENAGLWHFEVYKDETNLVTGKIDKEVPVIDAADLSVFISATKELSTSVPIHEDLEWPLAGVAGTNAYYVYPPGATLRDRLLPTYKNQKIYIHGVDSTRDWHEVAETTLVDERTAVSG